MSLTPAKDELEIRKRKEAIELCGKNRGPHDYIPIEWRTDPETFTERVTRLLCRVCFCNISVGTLIEHYSTVTSGKDDI